VARIEEQADRLHQLIQDLLHLAQVESGRQAFDIRDVSLGDRQAPAPGLRGPSQPDQRLGKGQRVPSPAAAGEVRGLRLRVPAAGTGNESRSGLTRADSRGSVLVRSAPQHSA